MQGEDTRNKAAMIYVYTENIYLELALKDIMKPLNVENISAHSWRPVKQKPRYFIDVLIVDADSPFSSLAHLLFSGCFTVLLLGQCKSDAFKPQGLSGSATVLRSDTTPAGLREAVMNAITLDNQTSVSLLKLTLKEMCVLRDCLKGMATSEMAEKYGISVKTVHGHKRNICKKMGMRKICRQAPVTN